MSMSDEPQQLFAQPTPKPSWSIEFISGLVFGLIAIPFLLFRFAFNAIRTYRN